MTTSNGELHIVGICGSLRKHSINKGLLRALKRQLPAHVRFTLADLSEIPFFNEDTEIPYPEPVIKLKELAESADAFVISTPEYNLSISGVLKNALEWLSRRQIGAPLAGKPVSVMGAAPIAMGTATAQSHLRDILFALNMQLVSRPILWVGNSRDKFDAEGNLTDAATEQSLGQVVEALLAAVGKKK